MGVHVDEPGADDAPGRVYDAACGDARDVAAEDADGVVLDAHGGSKSFPAAAIEHQAVSDQEVEHGSQDIQPRPANVGPVEAGELELFRHTWFPVARLEDVQPGPAQATLLDRELVIYRGAGGVTVADGWCPHRGMRLSMGRVIEGELECPYHGWRYEGGSGRCVAVPSLPSGAKPTRVCLNTYPVRIAYGVVWTALGDAYLPAPVIPELDGEWDLEPEGEPPHYRAGEWTIALGPPVYVACGVRALSENFRDMSHFAFVHRASMGPDVRREVDAYEVARDDWTLRYALSSRPEETNHQPAAPRDLRLAEVAYGRTNHYTVQLPSATHIFSSQPSGGRRFIAQFVAPVGVNGDGCRLFWATGVDRETRERHGVSVRDAYEFDSQVFREDLAIVENCWPREQPLDSRAQVHTRADAYSIAYRRLYRKLIDAYVAQSSTPATAGSIR
jgi:phenylpropionate dioxygenase-like ring-hydroxylating dioxygenase large terminal subunit